MIFDLLIILTNKTCNFSYKKIVKCDLKQIINGIIERAKLFIKLCFVCLYLRLVEKSTLLRRVEAFFSGFVNTSMWTRRLFRDDNFPHVFSSKMQHYKPLCKEGSKEVRKKVSLSEAIRFTTLEAAWHHPGHNSTTTILQTQNLTSFLYDSIWYTDFL